MPKDPLKSQLDATSETTDRSEREAESLRREIAKLEAKIAKQGNELEVLHNANNPSHPKLNVPPVMDRLQQVWDMAYTSALNSIFSKGLAYWNGNPKALRNELQLAAIRADEATENYTLVRQVSPDPSIKVLQDWQKRTTTDPITKAYLSE